MGLSLENLTQQRLERKEGWEPENVPALWEEIFETNDGSRYDPIPYNVNIALGMTYLCNRDTVNPVYNPLSELVGIYVEIVN